VENGVSPLTTVDGIVPDPLPFDRETEADWGTDVETEASASEAENKALGEEGEAERTLVKELSDIWKAA
jgi:hypothetical protein